MMDPKIELERWVGRVTRLVDAVEAWARELGWSTRRLDKQLDDHEIGRHVVPALLMQRELHRLMLEPVGRSGPGTSGIVDLYLLPAYDDIATFYCEGENWTVHYLFPGSAPVASVREAQSLPLAREVVEKVLGELTRHAA